MTQTSDIIQRSDLAPVSGHVSSRTKAVEINPAKSIIERRGVTNTFERGALITDALARHAADRPDQTLFTFLDAAGLVTASYTYGQFEDRTTAMASALLESGAVACGDHVLLVYPPGLDFITAFFACAKLGAVPIPVAPPDASGFVGGVEKLAYIADDARACVALSTDSFHEQILRLAERSSEGNAWLQRAPLVSLRWVATDRLDAPLRHLTITPNPLLFLQYTSGSTQQPRGVMVSHANVVHNAWATLQHRPMGVSWLPHYHDMGLIGYYLFIMITGGSMWGFSGAHFLRRPLLWLETITKYGGTITSAPNFAFEYCLREDKVPEAALASLDLSSMVCMMNASEPVRASTYERFQARFARRGLSPKAHVVFYGLAENTLSVTGNGRVAVTVNTSLLERNHLKIEAPRPDGYNQSRVMSCGRPLAGVDLRIVSSTTQMSLRDDEIGEIWLDGTSKTGGYLNKSTLSAKQFGATIEGDRGGATYLRTGDVGFIHDGELFICGRLKDMIIAGGRNYYPADIEAVVEEASEKIRPACVAAFAIDKGVDGEGIAVIAEARRASDLPDLDALCREIRKRCQVDVDLLAIVPRWVIAKTSSGKVARQMCRQRWEMGAIEPLAIWQRSGRPRGADPLIADLLARFNVDGYDDRTLADLGIDSLTLVELSLRLEEVFESQGSSARCGAAGTWSDLRILQAITVAELRGFLGAFADSGEIPAVASDAIAIRLTAIEHDELARMRADARLCDSIAPQPAAPVPARATVLLTGATGFLGSFLLESLLRSTDYDVVVLVRAEDDDHARQRVASALDRTGTVDADVRAAFDTRVRAMKGDMARPRLGVSASQWQAFANELAAVYHSGAEVDYVKPYEQLRDTNVVSTEQIIQLACTGRPKALHYVSTTFVFGFGGRTICRECDSNEEMAGLNFGYAQSKWVAEQLVVGAATRGLTAHIYRPALLTASRNGHYVRRDLIARILSYMICHGVTVDSPNQISLVPVDVCANNIVALSRAGDRAPPVVHITADRYYTMSEVCDLIALRCGYAFERKPLGEFMTFMTGHCPPSDPMFPLLAFFNENWRRIDAMRDKRYDSTEYQAARSRSPIAMPEPALEEVVAQIITFLQRERLVPAAPGIAAV